MKIPSQRRPGCRACLKGLPKTGPRRCPECGHRFGGRGWDGVETHWRLKHTRGPSYTRFWRSLCPAHRGSPAQGCPSCRKGIPVDGRRQCPECAQVFRGPGWSGIDAHWRSRHSERMSYEEFWLSLCPAHRGDRDRATGYLPLFDGR
jgi:hypothetical protein